MWLEPTAFFVNLLDEKSVNSLKAFKQISMALETMHSALRNSDESVIVCMKGACFNFSTGHFYRKGRKTAIAYLVSNEYAYYLGELSANDRLTTFRRFGGRIYLEFEWIQCGIVKCKAGTNDHWW